MKKLLLVSALALGSAFLAAPRASAQSAQFTFSPGTFSAAPGSTITFSINLSVVTGSALTDVFGLTYFLQQNGAAPFVFSITGRNIGASPFSDVNFTNAQVTSTGDTNTPAGADNALNAVNDRDLGGTVQSSGLASGTYFVADITLTLGASAPVGSSFTVQSATTGGEAAVVNDSNGNTFDIQPGSLTVTVVPEPSSVALLGLASVGLAVAAYRRRAKA